VKLNEKELKLIALTKRLVMMQVEKVPPYALGHGYLWGNITFRRRLKNGTLKTICVKTCFGGVCVNSFTEAERLARTVDGVSGVYINID
jgi:hypothetical protein